MKTSNNTICISSDKLRDESPKDRDNHIAIFSEMHKRTINELKQGRDVIYDSTNLELKYRKALYDKVKEEIDNVMAISVWIHNGMENAILQSSRRAFRKDVSSELIRQMYSSMELPLPDTDCDCILIPKLIKEKEEYKIIDSQLFAKNNFDQFIEHEKAVDIKLVEKYNKKRREQINER